MPLFDRLVDFTVDKNNEPDISDYLDEDGLMGSIQRELENILDTRLSSDTDLPVSYLGDEVLLPEFYGLRDFDSLSADSDDGRAYIAREIRAAILRFEPRLKDPKVDILTSQDKNGALTIQVGGDISINERHKPVTFPMTLRNLLGR